ncbi:2172_t:CDS:2, partial [Cetraspora pellucida]
VSSSRSLIHSKLLVTHQNAIDTDNFHSSKRVQIEDVDEIDKSCLVNTEYVNIDSCVKESNNLNNFEFEEFEEVGEGSGKSNRNQKEMVHDHGKEKG